MRKILLVVIFLGCALWQTVQAQVRPVTGTVTDQESGETLPGVAVRVKGTSRGAVTNLDGQYSVEAAGTDTLLFSFVGYIDKAIPVANRSVVDVALGQNIETLSEVVVVGYGEQQKKLVTGAISSVGAEELKTVSTGRIEQALQGRTAGVNVVPASGSPGAGVSIRIRGAGSNTNNEPLFVVDGVRVSNINYLDPSEIASMDILKDAASTAIYGAAAANGVIIITTKGGKRNFSEITYNGQYGVQSVGNNVLEMMSDRQYVEYLEEAGVDRRPSQADLADSPNTDWLEETFQTAPQQQHSLSFAGGGDNSTYAISGNYFDQEGIIGGDKARFERYTLRINSDHKLKPWLSLGERISFLHTDQSGIPENSEFRSVLSSAIAYDPLTPVRYTGALPAHVQAFLDAGLPIVRDENGNVLGMSRFVQAEYANPMSWLEINHGATKANGVVGTVYADIEPIKNLKFTTRYGLDALFSRTHTWTPTYYFTAENLATQSSANDNRFSRFNWQWENFATYSNTIGEHNFNVLAGTSAIRNQTDNFFATYAGLFKEEEKFSYPGTQLRSGSITGTGPRVSTLLSYFGRVTYDYRDKYLFTATVRRDGSSLLAEGNQWQTFPSVSAGWVISNEAFYPAALADVMNSAKLRASWGQNGNVNAVQLGEWRASVSNVGIMYPVGELDFVGAAPLNLPNPELRWETGEQLDIGADLYFFNNRLSFIVDYFKKTTIDLLTPGVAPGFAGNSLARVNGGNVENSGWEFELAYRNNPASDFTWEVSANLTALENEVTFLNPFVSELPGANVSSGWTATRFREGLPIWYFSGFKTAGIFQNQEQIDAYNQTVDYDAQPGDPIIVDVNGDGIISSADHTFIGSPHPDLMYGARVNLAYKGFDFLMFLQGQQGNEVLMGFLRTDRQEANKPAFFYEDRWTGEGSTNEWFRATAVGDVYNSDMLVFDGSYARVRQLQLGYTLPSDLLSRASIRNARIYVTLDNYFTFTSYPGLDPEVGSGNSIGIDRGTYPIPRRVMAGLTFSF